MSDDDGFYALAKFGREEHLRDFRTRGHLYMNTLSYFWSVEEDGVRRDWLEGADRLLSPEDAHGMTIDLPGGVLTIDRAQLAGPIKLTLGWTAGTHLFCMFAYKPPPTPPLVDSRNLAFGDSFVFLTDPWEFMRRLRIALKASGRKHRAWLVDYVDMSAAGNRPGEFRKDLRFSYQSEFRVALYRDEAAPADIDSAHSLFLGSLEDISSDVNPLDRINELIQVTPSRPA